MTLKKTTTSFYGIKANDLNIRTVVEREIKRLGVKADLNHIDVSEVTDMSSLFLGLQFDGNISEWDVSNVKNMNCMLAFSTFNGDISKWNVSNVVDSNYCFYDSPLGNHKYKQPKF